MNKEGIRQLNCLITLALLICFLFTGNMLQAQSPQVTVKMRNAGMLQVMKEIEKQTNYLFVFTDEVDTRRRVTVDVSSKPLREALAQMLSGTGIGYSIENNNIILTRGAVSADSPAGNRLTVRGTVKDDNGEPLVGATVMVAGSQRGVTTSFDGSYIIDAGIGQKLAFQFLGFERQEIELGPNSTRLDVVMEVDNSLLVDDVIVIGYGTVKKSDMTGSVVNVKVEDIESSPALSLDQALQGRIAGADIISTSGEPGAGTSMRIRGTRSITASNEPLIIVDGVMDNGIINDINMADVASVTVLKDASSTAIYGSKGANGVIIITTKQGASLDKPSITLKADLGFSQLPRNLDIMNATEFAQYRNDYALFSTEAKHSHIDIGTPLSEYPYSNPSSRGKGTNWIDEITRVAPYQNYNLSVSGKTRKGSYYMSLGYNDTRGIVRNSGNNRITGRLNVDHELFKWMKVGYKGSYTYHDKDMNLADIGGTTYGSAAIFLNPMMKANDDFNEILGNGSSINTPLAKILLNEYTTKRSTTNHSVFGQIDIAKGLRLFTQQSYYLFERQRYRYYPSILPAKKEGEGGEAYRASFEASSLNSENTLTYTMPEISGHSFDAMVGYTAYRKSENDFSLAGSGYMDDDVKWNNMNAVMDKETYNASTSTSVTTKMSYLARVNYHYKKKYYLTLTGRYDGASNFAANQKWAFFPSAAVKWNVAQEDFMKQVNWIDELSLRMSAGRTGNDAISPYRSMAAMTSTTGGYLFDGSQPAAFYRSRLDSPNLTWEKTDMYNVALDLSFLKGRLALTAEAYYSKTFDLLLTVQTPTQTGYSSRYTNVGKTSNKGVELSMESRNFVGKKFKWGTTFTMAHNQQKVNDIGTEDFVSVRNSAGNNPYMMYGYVKGYPVSSLWGFKYAGTWKSLEEFERNDVTKSYASPTVINSDAASRNAALGRGRYLDINHDGTLDQQDLVYQGNSDPWLYGGLQNNFSYGPVKLGLYFTYSLGGKIYNFTELYMAGSKSTNQYRYMLDAWHPVRNPYSDVQRAGSTDADVPSDKQIHDATYLRFKNISFSYVWNLQKKTSFVRDVTFSFNAENVYLWKKYNGFDPDVSTEDGASQRRVDMGAYPRPRTLVFSIQIRY